MNAAAPSGAVSKWPPIRPSESDRSQIDIKAEELESIFRSFNITTRIVKEVK